MIHSGYAIIPPSTIHNPLWRKRGDFYALRNWSRRRSTLFRSITGDLSVISLSSTAGQTGAQRTTPQKSIDRNLQIRVWQITPHTTAPGTTIYCIFSSKITAEYGSIFTVSIPSVTGNSSFPTLYHFSVVSMTRTMVS